MIIDHSIPTLVEDPIKIGDEAYSIELITAVKAGLAELDRGEFFTLEEVEKEIPSWIIR